MMRLAPLFFALLALCFLGCTGAPKSAADSAVTASADATGGKHFFWKVSDDNSSVWLLGSVHFADSTFYPLDAVIYSAFNTKLQGWKFVWFFGFIYFLYSITYTMGDISYWGMIPALSSDGDARNAFTARTTLFAGIGGTTAGILIPMFTTGGSAIGGSTSVAFGRIALIIAIICPAFLCFTLFLFLLYF